MPAACRMKKLLNGGGQSVCVVFLQGDAFSAGVAAGFEQSVSVSHAQNPEENQDFLWRLFSCFGLEKQCRFSLSGDIVNLPENSLKQGFSGPTS